MTREECIDRYCAAWNESDPMRRDRILEAVWAKDATYTDPSIHLIGCQPLSDHIGRLLQRSPGCLVLRSSPVDSHHAWARFSWKRVSQDGTTRAEGIDIAELSEDGKLQRIVGFFVTAGSAPRA
jgi:hypothetical protein